MSHIATTVGILALLVLTVAFDVRADGDRASLGHSVYASRCAACHGEAMQGADAVPPLTPPALFAPFAPGPVTAADLESWIRANMPANDPGTLTREESLAVTEWILRRNDLYRDAKPLDKSSAAGVRLRP